MAVVRKIDGLSAKVKTACAALNRLTGKVGWLESAVYPDGTPVAYVATIQEFGSPAQGIPPRSFMRTTAAGKGSEWGAALAKGGKASLQGNISAREVMEQVTGAAAGDIRRTISQITSPPLNPATVEARLRGKADKKHVGSLTKPLVDTGLMLQTLTSVVEGE